METEKQEYDEIIESYMSTVTKFVEKYDNDVQPLVGISDVDIRSVKKDLQQYLVDDEKNKGLQLNQPQIGVSNVDTRLLRKDLQQFIGDDEKKKGLQLFKAVQKGDDVFATRLLVSNPILMFFRIKGDTIVHLAAMLGNRSLFKMIINVINVNNCSLFSKESPRTIQDKDLNTALHLALMYEHKEMAFDILNEMQETNIVYAKNKYLELPITLAMKAGYLDLVEDMLKRAPSWNSLSDDERNIISISPLVPLAMHLYDLGFLQMLFDYMPGLAKSELIWCTPLNEDNNVEKVRYILKKFPNSVTELNKNGKFAIHEAIEVHNLDMVKEILSHYPEAINQVYYKWMPLSMAAYKGNLNIVRFLISNFPEYVTKCNPDGSFPIHWAVEGKEGVDIVKELISCFPESLYQVNEEGKSILHLAVKFRRMKIISYLKTLPEINKIFHYKDVDGNTFVDLLKKETSFYSKLQRAQETITK